MIKTILVPITGGHGEESVFETALAAARPLRGHIEFYRVRFSAQAAAVQDPHAGFCVGGATSEMLKGLAEQEQDLSSEANRHFHRFCRRHDIVETSSPAGEGALRVSAHLTDESEGGEPGLLSRSRRSDLIVLSRPSSDRLPQRSLIELLLLGSGHPVLVAPEAGGRRDFETIVVGWQETAAVRLDTSGPSSKGHMSVWRLEGDLGWCQSAFRQRSGSLTENSSWACCSCSS